MTGHAAVLAAYDALTVVLEELVCVCERHPGFGSPIELISEAAALVLAEHGQNAAQAFPRYLGGETMVTRPGAPPEYVDTTHSGRLRRMVA